MIQILKDVICMKLLDNLYVQIEIKIQLRKEQNDRKDVSFDLDQTQIFRHIKREEDVKIERDDAVNDRKNVLVEVNRKNKKY